MTVTSLVIGGGAGGGQVGVPDLQGELQADAEAQLQALELVPRIQIIEAAGDPGKVFSQNPPAGSVRPKKTVVTLLISKAPVVPPNLGQQLAAIKTAVDGVDGKVDLVVPAVQAVGAQVTGVDGKVDGLGTKLDGIGTKVDGVDGKVDLVAGAVDELLTKVDAIATEVAAAETDAIAKTRFDAIMAKLDEAP